MDALREQLPDERAYMPRCDEDALVRLGMKRAVVAPVVRRCHVLARELSFVES